MQAWFGGFDQEFQDLLVVNDVLRRGGGITGLFDALGKAKDPLGLASVLGSLGAAVSDGTRQRLSNRFAVERYLRGAEQTLVHAFRDGLHAAHQASGKPVALLFDTYEEMEALDDWVCTTLVPALPADTFVVILGRNAVHRINMDWIDFGDAVTATELPELAPADAKQYLSHYGLTDAKALDAIYQFTGGYPLLLVLVRQLAREAGGWDGVGELERSADRDRIASQLLERILREERTIPLRQFLAKPSASNP